MGKNKKVILVLGFLAALEMAMLQPLWACPLCSDLLNRSHDAIQALRFGRGIYRSIFVLLGVPLALVAGFAVFLILSSRKRAAYARKNML